MDCAPFPVVGNYQYCSHNHQSSRSPIGQPGYGRFLFTCPQQISHGVAARITGARVAYRRQNAARSSTLLGQVGRAAPARVDQVTLPVGESVGQRRCAASTCTAPVRRMPPCSRGPMLQWQDD